MKKVLLFSASILALGVSPSFAQTAGSVSKAAAPQAVDQAEINQKSNIKKLIINKNILNILMFF